VTRIAPSSAALALLAFALACEAQSQPDPSGTQALPGEQVVIPELRGVIAVPGADGARLAVPAGFSGVDTTRTPALRDPEAEKLLGFFLDKPASLQSLERLASAARTWLRTVGQQFVTAYVPPQDVTDGVVRLVVQRARLEGDIKVEGAKYFSAESYRAAVPAVAGQEIDGQALADGVERLNENPFRRATIAAEPGDAPGTTRLTLRARDERPYRFTLGYNNTGTRLTDEDRIAFSALWGDAFGRGDQLGYSFTADPRIKHSRSHAAHYTTIFPSRNSLTVYGSYSDVESILPEPLTQRGKSWQVGSRYTIPLRRGEWKPSLALSADFKYSDNTLEFAAIPVTDNETHVFQVGARWAVARQAQASATSFGAALYVSPGGVTGRNTNAAFEASRPEAKARYAYARFDARHVAALPAGFSVSVAGTLQIASVPLLGTEQLNGGGSTGVRGYREATAFGDEGVLVNTELHLPQVAFGEGSGVADWFAFFDAASLDTHGSASGSAALASMGIGLNLQLGQGLSLGLRVGKQLKALPGADRRSGHAHATLAYAF
jgi:hemolysin activation/secretion protein